MKRYEKNMPACGLMPAVVLSCHTMGLGVIRALGMMGVPVIAMTYEDKDMGHVSRYVRRVMYVPHPERAEDAFVRTLLGYAEYNERSMLIPADDATLVTVSKNKPVLDQHFLVACSDWKITEQFIDKKYTSALAETIHVPAPRTVVPASLEEAAELGKKLVYPCLVKPCQSHRYFELFGRKMVQVEDRDELLASSREAMGAGLDVMLQELIPGDDRNGINYNSYFVEGEPVLEFTAEKVRLSPPNYGVPCVVRSKAIPEVFDYGRAMLKALGFNGYSCMEFKRDTRDGQYKFMEINGRHNRSTMLAVHCGMNFPWVMYRHLTTGEMPESVHASDDVYWLDEIRDITTAPKHFRMQNCTIREFMRPYLRPHVFAVFDRKDPAPFFKRCSDLLALFQLRVRQKIRQLMPQQKGKERSYEYSH